MPGKKTRASDRRKEQPSQNTQPKRNPSNKVPRSTTSGGKTQAGTIARSTNEGSTVSSDGNTTSPTTPSNSVNKERATLYGWVYSLSKRGRGYLVKQLVLILPSIVLVLFGFKELPRSVPLFTFIEHHPIGSPIIGGVLLLITLTTLLISFGPEPQNTSKTPNQKKEWYSRLLMLATATSTTCCIFSTTLLVVVLARPSWCPTPLCPPLQTVTKIMTNPQGVHDANLEIYFLTFQSASYAIPGNSIENPPYLPDDKNPRSIGTVRIDSQLSSVYRVVLEAHSLYQGKYSILIDQVTVVIKKVPPGPRPLDVWTKGSLLNYAANPYQVVYDGQESGQVLPATYLPVPYARVQLTSGESDQLDVQVRSHVVADIQFQMQVTYRIATESRKYTLTLPTVFEVVFSDAENWHLYALQGGSFVPAP